MKYLLGALVLIGFTLIVPAIIYLVPMSGTMVKVLISVGIFTTSFGVMIANRIWKLKQVKA